MAALAHISLKKLKISWTTCTFRFLALSPHLSDARYIRKISDYCLDRMASSLNAPSIL